MHRTPRLFALVVCAVLLAAAPARAGQAVTSEKTRKKILELATKLETAPLAKKAPKDRRKVLRMLAVTPDLAVEPCRALLGDLLMSKEMGAQELLVQLRISSARFIIENPDLASDRHSVLLGGLEGVLRTYAAMRGANLLVEVDRLEELKRRRDRGELAAVVSEALANCEQ